MSDKDFLIDAVAQFLQADKWLNQVNGFFEEHYAYFMDAERNAQELTGYHGASSPSAKVKEYRLDQHELFVKYKDMVERLLEQMIQELGCTPEEFVDILQQSATSAALEAQSGERIFFLKTLLSFDDYESFHERMYQFGREKQQMEAAASSYTSTATDYNEASTTPGGYEDPAGYSDSTAAYSEWVLQESIANSILESYRTGELDPEQMHLVPWAEALIQLNQAAIQMAEAKGDDSQAAARYKELEDALIRERLKVDLIVAQRIADSNAEMKQQLLNLSTDLRTEESDDHTTAGATPTGEEELQSLFNQLDQIRDHLQTVKTKCFSYKNISHGDMDLIYLFLKEKVHYKTDLVSQQNEISEFVFAKIPQEDASIVPLLLEWLLLEAEGLRVQNQIQDTISGVGVGGGGSSNGANKTSDEESIDPQFAWTQIWDESTSSFYYYNRVTMESAWEPPTMGYWDVNNEFQYGSASTEQQAAATTTTSKNEPTAVATDEAKADAKSSSTDQVPTEGSMERSVQAKEQKEPDEFKSLGEALEAATKLGEDGTSGPNREELLQMESALEKLSRDHEDERKRLELTFEIEKARQTEEIRKRKEKKRKDKHKKKSKKPSDANGDLTSSETADAAEISATGPTQEQDQATNEEEPDAKSAGGEKRPLPPISSSKLPPLSVPAMPPVVQPPTTARRAMEDLAADAKQSSGPQAQPMAPPVDLKAPARTRIDLSSLLTEDHAKQYAEIKAARQALQQAVANGTFSSNVSSQAFLNPTSLRYLTEHMVLKKPASGKQEGSGDSLAIEEADAKD